MRKPSGKIKMIKAGESAKLKISALTGVHPKIVASGTQASERHGD